MNKNNRGFSLAELMIVAGLLGGLSLVVINITKQSSKSSVKLQFDTDVTLTTNEINGILSDPVKCLATFGTSASPVSINNGKYYISSNGSAPAEGYGNSGLKITSYALTGTAPDGVFTINYQNKNILKGSTGPTNIAKKINLYIEGAPGAITNCRSLSTSSTDIWTRGTATDANNIFYNGGVRAGNETQTIICDSTTEGTQRYNKATHAMEYCGYNAGPPVVYSWKAMGGTGSLGVEQTWQNVTASRVCGITYTNSTGKPIQVMIAGSGHGWGFYLDIGGVSLNITKGYSGSTGMAGSAIVPTGATYKLSCNNIASISQWAELRY